MVLTIHALDAEVEKRVRQKAREESKSINQTLKELLAESVGVDPFPVRSRGKEFAQFCGIWSEQEAVEFDAAVGATRSPSIRPPWTVRSRWWRCCRART